MKSGSGYGGGSRSTDVRSARLLSDSPVERVAMSDDAGRLAVVEAHRELVSRIEESAARIRALSVATVVVAGLLAASYSFQLALPLTGLKSVTVSLASPVDEGAEVVVLVLALVWLYVGAANLLFLSRVGSRIAEAKQREREIEKEISP